MERESCFQSALDDLHSLIPKFSEGYYYYDKKYLKGLLSLTKTYYAFGRNWGEGAGLESAFRNLEETVYRLSLEIQILSLTLRKRDANEIADHVEEYWVGEFVESIEASISPALMELHQSLYDDGSSLLISKSSSSPIEMRELLGMLDSLISSLGCFGPEKLMKGFEISKNFILFAKFQGLEHGGRQMGDVSNHFQRLVVDAARLIFASDFRPSKDQVDQLVQRMKPVERSVCEMYVGVLEEASKLPESLNRATTLESRERILLGMVDSLIFLLLELFFRGTSDTIMLFHHQMSSLYEGLALVRTILGEEHHEKMHNLMGVSLCESAMIVCYLFQRTLDSRVMQRLQHLFPEVDKKFKLIRQQAAAAEEAPPRFSVSSHFPQTNLLVVIDSIIGKMKPVNIHEEAADSMVALGKNKFQPIRDDLVFLRPFLVNFMGRRYDQDGKVQALCNCIAAVAYETEFVLDSLVVGGATENFGGMVNDIVEHLKVIKTEALEVSPGVGLITKYPNIVKTHVKVPLGGRMSESKETMVGLNDEAQKIIDRLARGTTHLDVVSIVGMPGLGKTTTAKKVYGDLSIVHYFQARAWCTISQVYEKRSLLLEILSSFGIDVAYEQARMTEDDLAGTIRKHLKGRKYLIVLDDVWDSEAWSCLKLSFPDDNMGSRILITSRNENVALEITPRSQSPHHLRRLSNDESLELFQKKIRFEEGYPLELLARGNAIAQRCKGLPLMIVIVAGLLSSMETSSWDEVEESIKNSTASTLDQCKETLELSYRHLPDRLKPCLLYCGVYKEDQKIRVRDLLGLWIAEGFVERTAEGCVEDVAKDYMLELVQRNLVMISETGSRGSVKYCILHDLLREFCLGKTNGDHFLPCLSGRELGTSRAPKMSYRLCIYSTGVKDFGEAIPVFPYLRTLFIDVNHEPSDPRGWYTTLYKFSRSKLLRVLDLTCICAFHFLPGVILLLGQLNFLSMSTKGMEFILPPSIASLSNLESLILLGHYDCRILLPNTLWEMKQLRYLYSNGLWVLPTDYPQQLSSLKHLHSFTTLKLLSRSQATKEVMEMFPNIRIFKIEFGFNEEEEEQQVSDNILALDFLTQLESVRITGRAPGSIHFKFPHNLKKLTLGGLHLPWIKISAVDRLPNLEVLKLQNRAFVGENWDMEEEGTFPKLRYLSLKQLNLVRWTDSDDNFPCLEKLVLVDCHSLVKLPSCFAKIETIQMIQVTYCQKATDSIKQIRKSQMDYGNEDLQVRMNEYSESEEEEMEESDDEETEGSSISI